MWHVLAIAIQLHSILAELRVYIRGCKTATWFSPPLLSEEDTHPIMASVGSGGSGGGHDHGNGPKKELSFIEKWKKELEEKRVISHSDIRIKH